MDSEYHASLNPPSPNRRFRFEISLLIVIILVLVALLGRCAFLQLSPLGKSCRDQALRQQNQVMNLPSRRGPTCHPGFRLLAASLP